MSLVVGIDPGLTGALALLDGERCMELEDMPVADGRVSAPILGDLLLGWGEAYGHEMRVILEDVAARPGQGVSSMFKFGRCVGAVEGVVGSLTLPLVYVTPARWKRSAGLTGREKDASRRKALELWPERHRQLARKKDNGRAEALLIARFGAVR